MRGDIKCYLNVNLVCTIYLWPQRRQRRRQHHFFSYLTFLTFSLSCPFLKFTESKSAAAYAICTVFVCVHSIYYHIWPKGSNCAYLQNESIAKSSICVLLFSERVYLYFKLIYVGTKKTQCMQWKYKIASLCTCSFHCLHRIFIEIKRMIKTKQNKSKIQTRESAVVKIDTKWL